MLEEISLRASAESQQSSSSDNSDSRDGDYIDYRYPAKRRRPRRTAKALPPRKQPRPQRASRTQVLYRESSSEDETRRSHPTRPRRFSPTPSPSSTKLLSVRQPVASLHKSQHEDNTEAEEVNDSSIGVMAPGYRANVQSRRNNRSNVDHHDVLEGIPVRQWRREDVTVVPQAAQTNSTPQNDIWAVELPHGMPKDSHLLPQHSQDLLRAFRSGAIYKRPAPVEEEEVDADIGEKNDKKEDDPTEKGFSAKAWKQIPRNQEGQPIEYLAKRRKGLITAGTKPVPTGDVPTVTKATVRRVDASGNTYEQELVIANGEKVEGEVISQTLIPDPNAIASAAELQPSPMKRKPIIKKKPKGPGRGRKKKIVPPTSVPPMQGDVIQTVEGAIGAPTQGDIKMETDNVSISAINEDTEMGDGSNAASDDDEGDEGEEGEDDEDGSQQNNSPTPDKLHNVPNIPASDTDSGIDNTGLDIPRPTSLERLKVEDTKSGSPLKNLVLTTSNVNSPITSPTIPSEEAGSSTIAEVPTITQVLEEPQLAPVVAEAFPPVSSDPVEIQHQTEIVQVSEENREDEMLLETAEVNTVTVTASATGIIPTAPASQEPQNVTVEDKAVKDKAVEDKAVEDKVGDEPAVTVDEIKAPVEEVSGSREKDDSPDLLGNLERQLE